VPRANTGGRLRQARGAPRGTAAPQSADRLGPVDGRLRVRRCGADRSALHRYGVSPRPTCRSQALALDASPPGEFEPPARVTTPLDPTPAQMLEWFVRRWTRAVTRQAARTHLGIEPPRQCNDVALGRTTPALFGLYSLVTRLAPALLNTDARVVRAAACYANPCPTFADAIAAGRPEWWSSYYVTMSESCTETIKIPRSVFERLTNVVCYAA